MSKRKSNKDVTTENSTATNKVNIEKAQPDHKQTVWVADGAGRQPVEVAWQPGDTVGSILAREQIVIAEGRTATLGQRRVQSMDTPVKAGETIVIAGKPYNG